ncbi:hypothetical protein AEAC466_20940 [Asticcacaulis sp. AC466]|uniref:hypothetical protein n=1 Tax=Asticcacaulis sp. AC466 TaxID=1282362 RepID=UPI0003C3AD54|nr:hypothetical protein [Asticcacaulis sp. AC466]ESQ81644.1 hypothetical protein AEAC466_20940 [Asticcacaulis sp. AC466]
MQIASSYALPASYGTSTATKSQTSTDPLSQIAPSSSDSAEASLMKFLKMSPAEKMQYTWLNSHGLTKEKLAAKSPEERAAIQKQMMQELQEQARQRQEKANGTGTAINVVV